jgi:hypothetical protein
MSENINVPGQAKPRFDPTINYGHVLTVSSFLIAAASAYYGMRAELQNVDLRVAKIESTLQQVANVLVQSARQGREDDRDRAPPRSPGATPNTPLKATRWNPRVRITLRLP